MMHFAKTLKTAAFTGLVALGFVAAAPAYAHYSYTRCDRDGDSCRRVVCDNDGDDCRSYMMHSNYYGGWRNGWRRSYDRDRRYDRGYYRSGYRRWVCDWDGDDCHWTYNR